MNQHNLIREFEEPMHGLKVDTTNWDWSLINDSGSEVLTIDPLDILESDKESPVEESSGASTPKLDIYISSPNLNLPIESFTAGDDEEDTRYAASSVESEWDGFHLLDPIEPISPIMGKEDQFYTIPLGSFDTGSSNSSEVDITMDYSKVTQVLEEELSQNSSTITMCMSVAEKDETRDLGDAHKIIGLFGDFNEIIQHDLETETEAEWADVEIATPVIPPRHSDNYLELEDIEYIKKLPPPSIDWAGAFTPFYKLAVDVAEPVSLEPSPNLNARYTWDMITSNIDEIKESMKRWDQMEEQLLQDNILEPMDDSQQRTQPMTPSSEGSALSIQSTRTLSTLTSYDMSMDELSQCMEFHCQSCNDTPVIPPRVSSRAHHAHTNYFKRRLFSR